MCIPVIYVNSATIKPYVYFISCRYNGCDNIKTKFAVALVKQRKWIVDIGIMVKTGTVSPYPKVAYTIDKKRVNYIAAYIASSCIVYVNLSVLFNFNTLSISTKYSTPPLQMEWHMSNFLANKQCYV